MSQGFPGPELLEAISPALLVTKATPPMFLWATAGDRLVPVQHSTLMATALANAGVPFEMHIFEQGDHGLALADQSTAHDVGQLNPDAARWAGLCQAWLEKRFALNLPQEAGW